MCADLLHQGHLNIIRVNAGVQVVLYASAYPAMRKTAESILCHQRAYKAEELCLPIEPILRLIPFRDYHRSACE